MFDTVDFTGDASPASSPGKSAIKDIKARLRQLGVSEDRIAQCVEKSELSALLEQVPALHAKSYKYDCSHDEHVHVDGGSRSANMLYGC